MDRLTLVTGTLDPARGQQVLAELPLRGRERAIDAGQHPDPGADRSGSAAAQVRHSARRHDDDRSAIEPID